LALVRPHHANPTPLRGPRIDGFAGTKRHITAQRGGQPAGEGQKQVELVHAPSIARPLCRHPARFSPTSWSVLGCQPDFQFQLFTEQELERYPDCYTPCAVRCRFAFSARNRLSSYTFCWSLCANLSNPPAAASTSSSCAPGGNLLVPWRLNYLAAQHRIPECDARVRTQEDRPPRRAQGPHPRGREHTDDARQSRTANIPLPISVD
jgi:hypothetical protein